MHDSLDLLAVIVILSIVQSLFGVGLLVFGTPSLLLLGYPFQTCLLYLLPCSIVISIMQVIKGRNQIEMKKEFICCSIPFLLIGLVIILLGLIKFDIKLIVGIILLLSAGVRTSQKINFALSGILKKYCKPYMAVMGFVHGISNMGGGLLTILASSLYETKPAIRANIAFGYLAFGLSQIITLLIVLRHSLAIKYFVLPVVPLIVFLSLGNRIFNRTSSQVYNKLITVFMFLYGFLLLYTAL